MEITSMNIGIFFIGTGNYINFFENYYDNCEKYLLPNLNKTYFCFTDAEFDGDVPDNIKVIPTESYTLPDATLKRFHTILKPREEYSSLDYLIYLDADMLVNEVINEDEFSFDSDFFGVHHPGFYKKEQVFPYEKRSMSQAYVSSGDTYWQGCFWGGKTNSVIELCEVLSERVDIDLQKNIIAEWHDESHINKFFLENSERVFTFNPEYAFPEVYDTDPNKDLNYPNIDPEKRKIIHLLKNHSEIRT